MTYIAYAIEYNGDRTEYTGLTKGRAIWRYNWFRRAQFNRPNSKIRECGWREEV